jgi:PPOX class probable F420-dependent enzyme
MLTDDQKSFLNGYLAQARIAVVVTQSPSGYAQITPNWFNWDGKRLSVSTTKERLKYKNLSRNPKLSVLIYEEPMAANYVTLRGEVEIQDDDGIWTPTRAILGRHLDADKADAYIERMKSTEQRVLLWLAPEQMTVRYP